MLISIIVPIYNIAPYLRECLDSILAQTFANWECICVDDGSSDESGTIVEEYARADARFRPVHKINGGEGSARNAGLELAKGEWICFLDGDDIWHRSFLEDINRMVDADSRIDMASVMQQNFQDGEEIAWDDLRDGRFEIFDVRDSLPARLFSIGVWSTAYKREMYGDLRFTDHCLGADRVYTMRCLSRAKSAAVMNNRDYGYRIRNNSMAHCAWTQKKISSAISFSRQCVVEIASCGKEVPKSVARSLCSLWLERSPTLICSVADNVARRELWQEWMDGLSCNEAKRIFSCWYRFVYGVLSLTRKFRRISAMCATFLCVAPYRLKEKGLRRR